MDYEYANGSSIFGSKYRTSVLYDFSIVQKAVFYIVEPTTGIGIVDGVNHYENYEIKETLPVQINPSKFGGSCGAHRVCAYPSGIGTEDDPEKRRKKHKKKSYSGYDYEGDDVSITLQYSIYDDYMLATMDGAIPVEDMTLMSPTATSMKKLQNYAGEDKFRTIFKWGDIEYVGFMDKVDYEYDAFSRWGHPLKGSATVHMYIDDIGKNETTYEPISPLNQLSAASAQIKAYTKKEEIAGRIALGLTAAIR